MFEKVCQYCKGTGQIMIPGKKGFPNKFGQVQDSYYYYTCVCINNKLINNIFGRLRGVPDITFEDAKQAGKIAGFKNLVIYGNEQKFLHLVKSMMVLHANYHHTFEFLNGTELVQKYYVEQPQGIDRTLSDVENKDLVVLMFDTSTKNIAQSSVVFEVIKDRFRMNDFSKSASKTEDIKYPTWVYARNEETLLSSKEYSIELRPYLDKFDKLDMSSDAYKISTFEVIDTETSSVRASTQDGLGM